MNNSFQDTDNLNQQAAGPKDHGEAFLVDAFIFFAGAWKYIVASGLLGIILAIAYFILVPAKYTAFAQISMARIPISDSIHRTGANSLGAIIEEPQQLISRLSLPTSLTPEVLTACGVESSIKGASQILDSIKLTQRKGVDNLVLLSVLGNSPQQTFSCANALFILIKTTQEELVTPYIGNLRERLDFDLTRLQKVKNFSSNLDVSTQFMAVEYLSSKDEIRFLLDEISMLKALISGSRGLETRLIAPIYSSETPSSTKLWKVLIFGLVAGIFLGLLLALTALVLAGSNLRRITQFLSGLSKAPSSLRGRDGVL